MDDEDEFAASDEVDEMADMAELLADVGSEGRIDSAA